SSPRHARMSVVLPAPLGPSRPTARPSISQVMSCNACKPPKRLLTPWRARSTGVCTAPAEPWKALPCGRAPCYGASEIAMDLDLVELSRIQFALTVMFHYLFPPLSIGLGLLMVV